MNVDFAAGDHTRALWAEVAPTILRIEALPFLNALAQGELAPADFAHYLQQDSLYLAGYARAMSLLAAKAPRREQARFWAQSCASAITVEENMHQNLLADPCLSAHVTRDAAGTPSAQPSPTTLGYVSYVIATASTQAYPFGVAGVLPCYWVYAHMGKVLLARAQGRLASGHPYETWIRAYDSETFDQSTRQAVTILEQLLTLATDQERDRMRQIFAQACLYEWHFWASAHARQGWEPS